MTDETKKYIDEVVTKVARELMHASHQGKSTEVSSLVAEIRKDFGEVKDDIKDIKNTFTKHETNFKVKSVNWDNTTKLVYGLVVTMLTIIISALMYLVVK